MLFTAPSFLFLFLPAMLAIYALIPPSYRRYAILLFNISFYVLAAWDHPESLALGLLTAAFTYSAGFVIAVTHKRSTLLAAIGVDLLSLIIYRIFYHYGDEYSYFPLGAAVYLLAAISYLVDIYRNDAPHAKNIADLLLYMFFFPVLIIGPFLRYKDFIGMIDRIEVSLANTAEGIRLFISGFIKRIAIAAVLGFMLSRAGEINEEMTSIPVILCLLLLLTAEIWFAFSGYSDMARGLMYMLGIPSAPDFQLIGPTRGFTDFNRGWFGSLNRWIEDYLVYPILRFQRFSSRARRIMVVCIICLVPAFWIKSRFYVLLPLIPALLWRLVLILREPLHHRETAKWTLSLWRAVHWFVTVVCFVCFCGALSADNVKTAADFLEQLKQGAAWTIPYSMYAVLSYLSYLLVGAAGLVGLIFWRRAVEEKLLQLPRPVGIGIRSMSIIIVMVSFVVSILHFLPQFPEYAVKAFQYVVF